MSGLLKKEESPIGMNEETNDAKQNMSLDKATSHLMSGSSSLFPNSNTSSSTNSMHIKQEDSSLNCSSEKKNEPSLDDEDLSYNDRVKANTDKDAYDRFIEWLVENGGQFPKLELREYEDEIRGVHSKERLVEDQVIIEIPLKCLITVEMGKESEIGRAVLESSLTLDAPKHIFLMLYMLTDRTNPNSFFKPYYDILPQTLSNMPIFWSPKELAELEGSYLLQQIQEREAAIEADYAAICRIAPALEKIATLDEFKWARMCVCSRNFGLEINRVRTAALVPYADMLNHFRPRETKWTFDNNRQAFTITTIQPIEFGAQVYDSYGQKCNHRFLLNYGFSIENNRESDGFCPNEVPIELQLDDYDPLYQKKLPCWERDASVKVKRKRLCVSDNENMRAAFSLARVIVADSNEFLRMFGPQINVYKTAGDIHYPVSIRNEKAVLSLLLSIIEKQLSRYPTTFEEDEALLKSNDPTMKPFSNRRHAVIQVKGEKEVLMCYRTLCTKALQIIEADDTTFESTLQNLYKESNFFVANYCQDVLSRVRQDSLKQRI